MPFAFHLPWLLLGLAAVVLPILIHLLNRRRYEVVDWGAMRFLEQSQKTRRKVWIEDLLLLLLRMLLIALLVLGLAGPFLTRTVTLPGSRPARDLVVILDGSASMGCRLANAEESAHLAALNWVRELLDELQPGDSIGLIDAREQPVVLLAPTIDHERVRKTLATLPPPEGACDAPAALLQARQLLRESPRANREILILTDGQKAGYGDANTRLRWEILAGQERNARQRDDYRPQPAVRLVPLDLRRNLDPPNWSLGPLRTTRGVVPAGREVLFRGEIEIHGKGNEGPPHRIALLVDGKAVRDLKLPGPWKGIEGKIPFSFMHRFTRPGSHLVTVLLEPDPPQADRPANYLPRDFVPADNRQDYALEVVPFLPVLLVDGSNDPDATDRGLGYLRSALAPANDPAPAIQVRSIALERFDEDALIGKGDIARPRVVVLQDVAALLPAQNEALERFLTDGGGLLVALGPNTEAALWNERFYRQGRGWLPGRIEKPEGDEGKPEGAARIVPGTSAHPVLELFREVTGPGSLETARFPRYWQVTVAGNDAAGNVMTLLRTPMSQSPFLVERAFGAGRVVLCTVPLDTAWGSTLPRLPVMVPLANELVSYLAGIRTQSYNLPAGRPLRYRSEQDELLESFTMQVPGNDPPLPLHEVPAPTGTLPAQATPLSPHGLLLTFDQTRRSGVYRLGVPQRVAVLCPPAQVETWKKAGAVEAGDEDLLQKILDTGRLDFDLLLCTRDLEGKLPRLEKRLKPRGLLPDEAAGTLLPAEADPFQVLNNLRRRTVYHVVARDRTEADLTPLSDADRADLAKLTAAEFLQDRSAWVAESRTVEERPELWWMVLLGLIGLLCAEVWMTSRIARTQT